MINELLFYSFSFSLNLTQDLFNEYQTHQSLNIKLINNQ